mgnify:CR=1 FL=1
MTRLIKLGICAVALAIPALTSFAASVRETPTVRAIQKARRSVANIHSEKITEGGGSLFSPDRSRKVNGMGTGVVIDERGNTKSLTVRRGTAVWVQDIKSGKKFRYTVVDASEANPLESKISDVSPLGKVFLGRQAGQQVTAETPRGTVKYKILEIA